MLLTLYLRKIWTFLYCFFWLQLAHFYRKKQNYLHAARYYKRARDFGNGDAEAWISYFYLMEYANLKNDEEAYRLSHIGIQNKIPMAFNNLGWCYQHGKGVGKNLTKAIELYNEGAILGNSFAQANLGLSYELGIGVEKNIHVAFSLYQHAADQGNAYGSFFLARCYDFGKGVKPDEKQAFLFYRMAADQGVSDAQNAVSVCYYNGVGVKENVRQALHYCNLAVQQNHCIAQYNMGLVYEYVDRC